MDTQELKKQQEANQANEVSRAMAPTIQEYTADNVIEQRIKSLREQIVKLEELKLKLPRNITTNDMWLLRHIFD